MFDKAAKAAGTARTTIKPSQKIVDLPKYHGRNIFVYSRIHTNQIVYSLERSLNNHDALQQLPYAGKHSVPRAIRKDLWRPFCTVLFPHGAQGRHAFHKLREWRKLHELSWDPTNLPKLNRLMHNDDKDKKSRAERRNGPLREGGTRPQLTDHTLRKRKMIMDQKATSVADLAAVLLDQERIGGVNAATIESMRRNVGERLQARLDDYSRENISQYQQTVDDQRTKLNTVTDKTMIAEHERRLHETSRHLAGLLAIHHMLSQKSFSEPTSSTSSTPTPSDIDAAVRTMPADKLYTLYHELQHGVIYTQEAAEDARLSTALLERRQERLDARLALSQQKISPAFTMASLRESPNNKPKESKANDKHLSFTPIRVTSALMRNILKAIRRGPPPVFSSQGVEIKWANPLDAEHALEWPADVVHAPMGYARHTAPPALSKQPRLGIKDGLFDIKGRFIAAASRIGTDKVKNYTVTDA